MAVPDSGWLDKIERAPSRVLLGISGGTGAGWWLVSGQPVWQQAAFAACCITATILLIVNIWLAVGRSVERRRANRLKRSFEELSDEQTELLRLAFERGSREVTMDSHWYSRRWFEELITWNYVERNSIDVGRHIMRFWVTEKGWQELEQKLNR